MYSGPLYDFAHLVADCNLEEFQKLQNSFMILNNLLRNGHLQTLFCLFSFSQSTFFTENCRLQWDLNSNHLNRSAGMLSTRSKPILAKFT